MTLMELFVAKHLRFEHHPDGFGIGTGSPRLSWRYDSKANGEADRESGSAPGQHWSQKTYIAEVRILEQGSNHRVREKHRSEIASDSSLFLPWPAPALRSRDRAFVRVLGHNSNKKLIAGDDFDLPKAGGVGDASLSLTTPAEQSNWAPVEVGLLNASDWKATFITSPDPPEPDDVPHRPTIYRKVFTVDKQDTSYARLYITSLGIYEAHINGKRVGNHHMAPGWTSYHNRVQYQTHDVSSLLKHGENVITVEVAEGWYAGRLTWVPGLRNLYGDKPAFIAQLELHNSGALAQVLSDTSWTCHPSPRQSASIYDGEVYDARTQLAGLHETTFRESPDWKKASVFNFDFAKTALVSTDQPPVRITQVVDPIKVFTSPSGKTLVDFGQNLVGRVCVRNGGLQGRPAGHRLTIRHAEVLENGELGTRPLRDAKATDAYVFSGTEGADDSWAPQFTFHGFRYIELTGWSTDEPAPSAATLCALVVGSDLRRTGTFTSSHALVNKLHANVVWSMRGNFLAVPTDCPQRDERLGWTGDLQVFAPTATFLFSAAGFLANWLADLALDQRALNGTVPLVVPDVLHGRVGQDADPVAVWDDAAVLVPWAVYRASGDAKVLRDQFASMTDHLRKSVRRSADGLWDAGMFQYGDWLDPNAPNDNAALARTDGTLVADAYLAHVTSVVAQIAAVIGDAGAARSYQAEADALKVAFAAKYVAASGLVVGDSQCALALAICFDLLATPSQLAVAGERLARQVRAYGFKVATGFAGTPLVLHALTKTGNTALAYRMLTEQGCPSWLYPVTMGATTIWERWDSMRPDGSINPDGMTSFNHYALGSVADWLHGVVGGVQMLEAGWRSFRVKPEPGEGVESCEVRFEGPGGWIGCRWWVEGVVFRMRVEVPVGARALIVLPGQEEAEGRWVGAGEAAVECLMGEEWVEV